MARPKHAILTRERIGRAAIAMLDAGEELQVTPLAKHLGVSVSSLYHHVSGRADIAHAMREAVTATAPMTAPAADTWQGRIRQTLDRLWRSYAAHPRAVPLLLSVPISEAEFTHHYSDLVEALRTAQVPEHQLIITVAALDAFALGAALDSLVPATAYEDLNGETSLGQLLAASPTGAQRTAQVYERGLALLLTGIAATVADPE